ncbi:MAG TPA: ammonium transporter [Mycobacteriales bacterium]|nr:ammonium transporter [Mycobacteriales bacterium]
MIPSALTPAAHLVAAAGVYSSPKVDSGDTAWLLASCALVLLMTPGLAFFYAGMVRAKNALGMLMQNYFAMGIVSVLWVLFTFSLAFDKGWGHSGNAFIGGFHFAGLMHATQGVPGYTLTIPLYVFVAFQAMFAIITPALIVGSTADRWRFGAFVVFITLWAVLDYSVIAHWVFDPYGWLFRRGAEDFAGGTVVHANAGAAGLAMCLVLGKRKGWPKQIMKPHNVPYVLLGAGLLWFGWFGFNAGSALSAGGAATPFLTTNTATAAALLGWIIVERIRDGKATTLGAASGAVAGLVAITPACAFVSPIGSIILGLFAGALCCLCTTIKYKLGFDDSLDVVAVHLVGGVTGALSLGFLGNAHYAGVNGLFYGGSAHLLFVQFQAVAAVVGYSFCLSFVLGKVIGLFMKNKMTDEQQDEGMDLVLHGEAAYEFEHIGVGAFAGSPPAARTPGLGQSAGVTA